MESQPSKNNRIWCMVLPPVLIIALGLWILLSGASAGWREYAWPFLTALAAGWSVFLGWRHQMACNEQRSLNRHAEAARERSQAALDAAADGVITVDGQKIIQRINPGAIELFGYPPDEIIGKPADTLFAHAWRLPANSFMDVLLQQDDGRESLKVGESLALHKSGTEFPVFLTCSVTRSGGEPFLFLLTRDISARKKVEQRLNRSAASQKVLNQLLRLSLSPGELDSLLSRALYAIFSFPWVSSLDKGAVFLNDPANPAKLRLAAQHGMDEESLNLFNQEKSLQHYCGLDPEAGSLEVCTQVGGDRAITYCSIPPEAFYNLPIISGDRCLGMIVLFVVQSRRRHEEQLGFLESVSHTLAGLIEMRLSADALKKSEADLRAKQDHLNKDLSAAADIQHTFLPKSMPELSEIDLIWKFVPNQHIGGDIFNAYMLDDLHLMMYMVDVSGHGVPSGLVTVSVHEMLAMHSGHVRRPGPDGGMVPVEPYKVLEFLSDEYPVERFDKTFSIAYLLLNIQTGRLTYASAGHPPPMLIRSGGGLQPLDSTGTIIGFGSLLPIEQEELALKPGDKLLLYTDGVVEYADPQGALYGDDRFRSLLDRKRDRDMGSILDAVWESMMRFGGNTPPRDDVSLLGLTYNGSQSDQVP